MCSKYTKRNIKYMYIHFPMYLEVHTFWNTENKSVWWLPGFHRASQYKVYWNSKEGLFVYFMLLFVYCIHFCNSCTFSLIYGCKTLFTSHVHQEMMFMIRLSLQPPLQLISKVFSRVGLMASFLSTNQTPQII